jgi:hypothetical protein
MDRVIKDVACSRGTVPDNLLFVISSQDIKDMLIFNPSGISGSPFANSEGFTPVKL